LDEIERVGGKVAIRNSQREIVEFHCEGLKDSSDVNAGLIEVHRRGRNIYSPIESAEIMMGVMQGKPWARRPILATASWKRDNKWLRFPMERRGKRRAGVEFLRGHLRNAGRRPGLMVGLGHKAQKQWR